MTPSFHLRPSFLDRSWLPLAKGGTKNCQGTGPQHHVEVLPRHWGWCIMITRTWQSKVADSAFVGAETFPR